MDTSLGLLTRGKEVSGSGGMRSGRNLGFRGRKDSGTRDSSHNMRESKLSKGAKRSGERKEGAGGRGPCGWVGAGGPGEFAVS